MFLSFIRRSIFISFRPHMNNFIINIQLQNIFDSKSKLNFGDASGFFILAYSNASKFLNWFPDFIADANISNMVSSSTRFYSHSRRSLLEFLAKPIFIALMTILLPQQSSNSSSSSTSTTICYTCRACLWE